jgi:hypothetical protein
MEKFPLSIGAVLIALSETGARGKTSKPPWFTKYGQEPNAIKLVESSFLVKS